MPEMAHDWLNKSIIFYSILVDVIDIKSNT